VAEVIIQESESLENALRRFKRKVQQEDIIKEIKKHSFYMKPGGPKKRFRGSDCARSSGAKRTNLPPRRGSAPHFRESGP
jgi:small subunit ribosomal protein S21